MGTPRRGLTLALVVGCVSLLATGEAWDAHASRSELRHTAGSWCGSRSADWICRWNGVVLAEEQMLPRRRARRIPTQGTKLNTGPTALARLTFENRARCTLGGNGQPGEFFARRDQEVLFRQVLGFSSCTSLRGQRNEVSLLCSAEERCPGTLKSTGTFVTKSTAPQATASATETLVRHTRIVACTGFIRVRVEDESGVSEAAGEATGVNRFIVTIEETVRRTDDETINATETSRSVRAAGGFARVCRASVVERQEQTFIP